MAEKLSTAQQTVIDRMAAGDALTRGVSSRRAYVGSGNTRRMVAFFNMNELQDRGLIERCDRIGQPFITWCLTDAGRALATVSAAPTADTPDSYTITALEAANDGALWTLVARGEVEVTSPFGATLIKSHGRHRNMFEFTARDDANDSFPTALLYSDILTVHRQQPPTDTPPASYRAARGAFAWQEGDEPAEATIRRIRGGEPPAAYFMPDPRKALAELATLGEASRAGMVGDYLNTLEKERDALQAANAQLAARAQRAEAALKLIADVAYGEYSAHEYADDKQNATDWKSICQIALDGLAQSAALHSEPLADGGDAQTEDGG